MATKIIGDVAVKVRPDTSKFKNDLKSDLRRIEKQIGNMKVEVVPSINKAAEQKVKAQMDKLRKQLSGKNVNLNAALNQSSAAVVAAQVSALTKDRTIRIDLEIDNLSLASATASLLALGGARVAIEELQGSLMRLKELDRLVPKIGMVSTSLLNLTGTVIGLTGHTISLGGSLAQITPLALALPGAFAGMAVGMGITAAALKDFNDRIPELAGMLKTLQNQLSNNFWAEAEAPIRNMIESLWPAFSAGVRETSTALGTFFGNLATSFSSIGPALTKMFDALALSVQNFAGYTDAIVGVIKELGLIGSAQLPALATWFGEILTKFNDFLAAARKSGDLQEWIDTAVTNLQALGSVIAGISKIFYGLWTAADAAGGSTLVTLADRLNNIADIVNSPAFQSGLTDTFRAAFQMMSNFADAAGPGFEAVFLGIRDLIVGIGPDVAQAVGTLVGAIGEGLGSPAMLSGLFAMFDGLTQAIYTLVPAIDPVATMLGSLGPVIAALATNIAMLLAGNLDKLVPTFLGLASAIVPIINLLGGLFNDVLTSLTPVFQSIGEQITNIVVAFGPLITAVQNLWNLLAPVLIPVLQFLAQLIGETVVLAINGVTDVINGLVTFLQGVVALVVALFHGDWSAAWQALKQIAKGALQAIWGAVQTIFAVGVLGLLRKGWQAIKALFTSSGATLKTLMQELWASIRSRTSQLWDEIVTFPQTAMSAIVKFIRGIAGDLKAAASLAWEAIVTSAKNQMEVLLAIFKNLPGKIKGFLAGAGTLLLDAGRDIISGLIDGVTGMIGDLKDKFDSITDMIPDWKGPAPRDKVLLTPAGEMIIDGLIRGLESRYTDVYRSLTGLTEDIAKQFDSGADYRIGVATQLDMADGALSAIGGLDRTISVTGAANAESASEGNVHIDNITIPLEDLQQLKSLEEFLDMLRVRTRQGVIA